MSRFTFEAIFACVFGTTLPKRCYRSSSRITANGVEFVERDSIEWQIGKTLNF
jgi:hypothetical protein